MDLYQFSDCSFFYSHEGEMAPKAKHSIKDEAKLVLLLLALWSLECHFDMCPSGLAAAAWAGKAEWDEPTTRGCFHGNKLQNEFNYLSRIFVPICQIGMLICAQVQGRLPRWAGTCLWIIYIYLEKHTQAWVRQFVSGRRAEPEMWNGLVKQVK